LELAATLDARELGIYGYLIANSPTIGALFEAVEHYQPIFMRGMRFKTRVIGEVCDIQWRIFRPHCNGVRQDVEFTLAALLNILRDQLGEDLTPLRMLFAHEPVEPTARYREFFGVDVEFGASSNSLIVPQELLATPLADGDPRLLAVLKQQADNLLERWASRGSLIDHVKLLIATSLENDSGGVERLSGQLYVTSRTLNRWLTRAGTSYQKLREEVILKLARESLARSDASITAIAGKLGYSESSAFVRAFKRLSGSTPTAYRKAARSGAAGGVRAQ
jgi:AraC-like DNA-binding protein